MSYRYFLVKKLLPFSVAGLLASTDVAAAQSVEQFYRGRTINFLVASAPGGVNDLMARLISRHIGKHIPGNPNVVPQNMTGASGIKMTNYLYLQAPRDGSAASRGSPTGPMLAHKLFSVCSSARHIESQALFSALRILRPVNTASP